jgi:hypothetical protein
MMLLIMGLLALQPQAPTGVGQVPTQAVGDSHRAAALRLAELELPEAGLAISQPNYASEIASSFVKTPQGVSIEQQYPGFALRFSNAAQPILQRALYRRLPELHQQVANIYAAEFTDVEMAEMAAFLQSSAGRKFISDARARVRVRASIAQGYKNARLAAGKEAFADATDAEREEIERYFWSPVGQKAWAAQNRTQPLVEAWTKKYSSDPTLEAQMNALSMKVMGQIAAEKSGRK